MSKIVPWLNIKTTEDLFFSRKFKFNSCFYRTVNAFLSGPNFCWLKFLHLISIALTHVGWSQTSFIVCFRCTEKSLGVVAITLAERVLLGSRIYQWEMESSKRGFETNWCQLKITTKILCLLFKNSFKPSVTLIIFASSICMIFSFIETYLSFFHAGIVWLYWDQKANSYFFNEAPH